MRTLCVITARGGSKRIPHKNIRKFCGKPIIAYSIEAALDSALFNEVMVSTDDDEIASIAIECGANVPFMRSASTSHDTATTADAVLEVLDTYEEKGISFDAVCCIYPTAPFVTAETLAKAYEAFQQGYDSVLTAVAFSYPPQRGFVSREGVLEWWQPEHVNTRSQDLETVFHDAGQFYFALVDVVRKKRLLIGEHAFPYIVPEEEAQDIDNESDWILAEMKYERMLHGNEQA